MVTINPFQQMGGPGAKQPTHCHLEGRQSHDPTDRDGKAERATVFLKARLRTAHDLVHSNCHRQRPVTAKPTVTITRTPNPQGLSLTTEDLQQQVTTTNSHAPWEGFKHRFCSSPQVPWVRTAEEGVVPSKHCSSPGS